MASQPGRNNFSDMPPSTEQDARQLIQDLRKSRQQKRSATPDSELDKFRRMQDRILESLDDASHVIPELLQNADDVGQKCTEATLRLTDDALVVRNHSESMTESEIAALGEFTKSTKRDLAYIGHFGIGFKTVFSVTDSPHIETGYASFKYNRSDPEKPIQTSGEHVAGTRIRLPFADELPRTRREALQTQLKSVDRLLPFLNNLKTIHVELDGESKTYERSETDGIRTIQEKSPDDDTSRTVASYRLFSKALTTDSAVFEMLADEREFDASELEGRNAELNVSIGIPVAEDGSPVQHSDSRLFCYFPTADETYLPFDVQADFLLKSNREKIRPGHTLNDEFLTVAGELIETAIDEFEADDVPPERLLELIPKVTKNRPDYLSPLLKQTREILAHKQLVPTASGDICQPRETVILPKVLRPVLPLAEFAQAYPEANAHPREELDYRYYERLESLDSTDVLSVADTLEQLPEMDILQVLDTADIIELLAAVEKHLRNIWSNKTEEQIITALESLPVFSFQRQTKLDGRHALTEAGGNIYRPARQDESVYEPFYDELDLLSGDLVAELRSGQTISGAAAGRVRDLLGNRLDIEELTHRDIVRDVINEAFEEPTETSDSTLDGYIQYVRDHARKHINDCEIMLRAKDGTYTNPESLYLPTEYNEDRYRSTLIFNALTDRAPVSESYLEQTSEETETDVNVEKWRSFFVDLGVRNHIPVSEDVDQCTKETFDSADKLRDFLDAHNDEGTDVRKDKDTVPYGGRGCSWMRSADARHGLVDQAFPSSFEQRFEKEVETTPEIGAEFAKMLDVLWVEVYQDAAYREYYFSVPDNGYATRTETSGCPTTFTHFLRSIEWLPGEDGELYQPDHLFEHNSVTVRADVTLLAESVASLSKELLDLLDVRDDVGLTEHRIGIEQTVAERPERDADEIDSEIRSHLHSLADQTETASEEKQLQLARELQDCSFIYIPEANLEFRTLDRVAWGEGLGEYVVPMNTYYRGFHDLFVEVLGVPPEPTFDAYLEFFKHADEEPWSAIDSAWRELIRRVVRDDSINLGTSDIAAALQETDAIPNANKSLVSYDDIEYVARQEGVVEEVPDTIANTVAFPSYDQRFDRDEVIDSLSTILDAVELEVAMERNATHPEYKRDGQILYDEFNQCLEVGTSILRSRDEIQAAERLESVAEYTLQKADTVKCKYRLEGQERASAHEEPVYIDEKEKHMLLENNEAAKLDLVDALSATIGLTGADKNAFVNFVKGAIGKPTEMIDAYLAGENISRVSIAVDTTGDNGSAENSEGEKSVEESDTGDKPETDQNAEPGTQADNTTKPSGHRGESIKKNQIQKADSANADDSVESNETQQDAGKEENLYQREQEEPDSEVLMNETGDQSSSSQLYRESETWPNSGGSMNEAGDQKNVSPLSEKRNNTPVRDGKLANEIGRQGEEFVMSEIKKLLIRAFDTKAKVDEYQNGHCLTGRHNETEKTVHVEIVPDKSSPHCDILVTGASLQRERDELLVESIADDVQALIEVKSSKNRSRTFELTGPEYSDARDNPETYFIVRAVEVNSNNQRVEAIFDSVPELKTTAISDDRLKIKNHSHTLTLSY